MEIRRLEPEHLSGCVVALMKAYNCPPWNNHWSRETSERYLSEFMSGPRFVGFVLCDHDEVIGAAFCHEKTWWTNDELFVDEFYIVPDFQRRGHGNALLHCIADYIRERRLAGFTLLTNRFMPALEFYRQNGFVSADHVIFMYKEI